MYWCSEVRKQSDRVHQALYRIEVNGGTPSHQSWKDHAAGTRKTDCEGILEWLKNHAEDFQKSHFDRYLESLIMDKLVYFQVNHKFHKTGGLLKWKVGKDKYENKTFEPHELVHPCWSMSPRPPNPCLSQSVTPSRFRDGCTVGYLPMSMHACYTSTRLTRMSHPENGMGSSPTGKPNILSCR